MFFKEFISAFFTFSPEFKILKISLSPSLPYLPERVFIFSNDSLKTILTPLQYEVTQNCSTEPPFDNEYWDNEDIGIYVDIITGVPLFASIHKYKSGTGWPSFYESLPEVFETKTDHLIGYARTEYHCKNCGGHHGHIFEDGPKPTGKRYCNNGVCLVFKPK